MLASFSDDKDMKHFIARLKVDEWIVEAIPSTAKKGNMFNIYQDDTIKLSKVGEQTSCVSEMATMRMYQDIPYLALHFKSNLFTFKVPKEVAAYLNANT